eukprot:3536500-Lingulodinium_polyedra.AAC.1
MGGLAPNIADARRVSSSLFAEYRRARNAAQPSRGAGYCLIWLSQVCPDLLLDNWGRGEKVEDEILRSGWSSS